MTKANRKFHVRYVLKQNLSVSRIGMNCLKYLSSKSQTSGSRVTIHLFIISANRSKSNIRKPNARFCLPIKSVEFLQFLVIRYLCDYELWIIVVLFLKSILSKTAFNSFPLMNSWPSKQPGLVRDLYNAA